MLSDREKAAHLLNRTAFGPWFGDVDRVLKMGLREYVEEQLHPEAIDDSEIDKWDSAFDILSMTEDATRKKYPKQPLDILNQLRAYKVMRAIHSKRQLHEVLTDFWFNHFNVYFGKEDVPFVLASYERQVIRRHALGRFRELLAATASHPAMLIYLDNAVSSREHGVNENYARELMELHTMGVNGGYTQRDVEEVARCFSGWTIDRQHPDLALVFRPDMHEPGNKTVLGTAIAAGGANEGEAVLDILVAHPSTARFIASKLVRRFVSNTPPPSLVSRAAEVFTSTNGDIRAVVRTILTSDEFFAPEAFQAKTKNPFEMVVSVVRALDVDVRIPRTVVTITTNEIMMMNSLNTENLAVLANQRRGLSAELQAYASLLAFLERMRYFLYQHEAPTGYPEQDKSLETTIFDRMQFSLTVSSNGLDGLFVKVDSFSKFLPEDTASAQAWEETLAILTGVRERATSPGANGKVQIQNEVMQNLALALGSPTFQQK